MHHGRFSRPGLSRYAFRFSGDESSEFGFLFRQDHSQPSQAALLALADTMRDPAQNAPDSIQPAGFTFFGQFVDHDITFTQFSSDGPADPSQPFSFRDTRNARTPRLDLDSVFGAGPASNDSVALYDPVSFRLLLSGNGLDVPLTPDPNDATRLSDLVIGDPRNSENLIIRQLHVVFMRLYNRFLGNTPGPAGDITRYEAARRKTVRHYQHAVLYDYLPRIVGRAAVDAAIARNTPFYRRMAAGERTSLIMPVEFAFAAFRFGHSQVRPGYLLQIGQPGRATFAAPPQPDLNGDQIVTDGLVINWDVFFELSELDGAATAGPRNISKRFDTKLAPALFTLKPPGIPAGTESSLAARNLLRGANAGLSSGQAIARALRIPPLADDQLGLEGVANAGYRAELTRETPLWYYVLREAEILGNGTQLAGVGAFILAETFIGLLKADEHSILNNAFTPDPGLETVAGICAAAWPNRGRGRNPAP